LAQYSTIAPTVNTKAAIIDANWKNGRLFHIAFIELPYTREHRLVQLFASNEAS